VETNQQEQEAPAKLRDMNGNPLRQGDLVMVLLEKPMLVGFITEINEPSILTTRSKDQIGVITVTGTVKLMFKPTEIQMMRQMAKLVDPNSEALISAIMQHAKTGAADIHLPPKVEAEKQEPAPAQPQAEAGPRLVPEPPVDQAKS
jgi:hypothetical protein